MKNEKERKRMRKEKFIKIVGLMTMLIIIFILGFIYQFPIGLRHFVNLVKPPDDLYNPILIENFNFKVKNYTKTYRLKPKYADIYELGLVNEKEKIPTSFKFNGIMEMRLYHKNKQILNKIIDKTISHTYSKKDSNCLEKVVFTTFPMSVKGRDKNSIFLKVTVIQPDDSISQFAKLYVAVSDLP